MNEKRMNRLNLVMALIQYDEFHYAAILTIFTYF